MFKIKNIFMIASVVLSVLAVPVIAQAAPVAGGGVAAPTSAGKRDACLALKEIDPANSCGTGGSKVNGIIRSVIFILSFIVGFVSVIMVIISGFKYVTSGGDSGGVASAKTTLIYALVGLVIVALAQIIVATVLSGAIDSSTPPAKRSQAMPITRSGRYA